MARCSRGVRSKVINVLQVRWEAEVAIPRGVWKEGEDEEQGLVKGGGWLPAVRHQQNN